MIAAPVFSAGRHRSPAYRRRCRVTKRFLSFLESRAPETAALTMELFYLVRSVQYMTHMCNVNPNDRAKRLKTKIGKNLFESLGRVLSGDSPFRDLAIGLLRTEGKPVPDTLQDAPAISQSARADGVRTPSWLAWQPVILRNGYRCFRGSAVGGAQQHLLTSTVTVCHGSLTPSGVATGFRRRVCDIAFAPMQLPRRVLHQRARRWPSARFRSGRPRLDTLSRLVP